MADLATIIADAWADWGLIDCGNGQKLERYGPITVARPEPQAMWTPAREGWNPDATFVPGSDEEGGGRWVEHRPVPRHWELTRGAVRFNASLTYIGGQDENFLEWAQANIDYLSLTMNLRPSDKLRVAGTV